MYIVIVIIPNKFIRKLKFPNNYSLIFQNKIIFNIFSLIKVKILIFENSFKITKFFSEI